jgi:5-formyltetrahydrofolate cyclo-ligase
VKPPMTENEPFGEELRLEVARRAKRQIRARMKALRQSYPKAALEARSARVRGRLLELEPFQTARSVALYWPLLERGEVDLRDIFSSCLARDVKTYFPYQDRLEDGRTLTGFRQVLSASELTVRGNSFYEPPPARDAATPGDIDLVVVPALAADTFGHRIGYGAGYYDATLGDVAPPAVVVIVAFGFQMLAELPTEAHDVPADYVVTEDRIWTCARSGRSAVAT